MRDRSFLKAASALQAAHPTRAARGLGARGRPNADAAGPGPGPGPGTGPVEARLRRPRHGARGSGEPSYFQSINVGELLDRIAGGAAACLINRTINHSGVSCSFSRPPHLVPSQMVAVLLALCFFSGSSGSTAKPKVKRAQARDGAAALQPGQRWKMWLCRTDPRTWMAQPVSEVVTSTEK